MIELTEFETSLLALFAFRLDGNPAHLKTIFPFANDALLNEAITRLAENGFLDQIKPN